MPRRIQPLSTYYRSGLESFSRGDAVGMKVFAVVGYGGDWAAYQGSTDLSDEEIIDYGDKLGKEAAEALFPTFRNAGLEYRY